MALSGVSHVAITVSALDRSKEWYGRVLGWRPVFDGTGEGVEFCVGSLPGGLMLGLREYAAGTRDVFDPTRIGMDHLALSVDSADELPDWEQRFRDLGVTYDATQNTPLGAVLNFKDPDGVALELFAPPLSAAT